MAKVKNVSVDVLSLFSADAPPCNPGDTVTVRDERFVGRAWPKSTWQVVEAPDGYADVGPDDAYVFELADDGDAPEPEEAPADAAAKVEPNPPKGRKS